MERQMQARRGLAQSPATRLQKAHRASPRGVQPVVGFVGVQQAAQVRKADAQHILLAEKATAVFEAINTRQLRDLDDLVAEHATCHDDGMWLLQPAKGRSAIRNVWRDWLRSVPDYKFELLHVATEPTTNDAFVMWRATGMARLSLIPQRPTTNKPFEHCGVTRLHLDDSGAVKDLWTWRGATADEAAWLLSRSYKSFDPDSFLATTDSSKSSSGSSGNGNGAAGSRDARKARAKGAALAFREVFGAVPGASVGNLASALSDDYKCKEGTGVWRATNLASREACMEYCQERQDQLAGSPYWHSEAMTPDGRMMFVHFQNVLMNKGSGTLMGLSSGILVHAFDEQQQISRSIMFRGPMSFSERAQFYTMDCRGCGNSQAEKMGVDESRLGGI